MTVLARLLAAAPPVNTDLTGRECLLARTDAALAGGAVGPFPNLHDMAGHVIAVYADAMGKHDAGDRLQPPGVAN